MATEPTITEEVAEKWWNRIVREPASILIVLLIASDIWLIKENKAEKAEHRTRETTLEAKIDMRDAENKELRREINVSKANEAAAFKELSEMQREELRRVSGEKGR